MKRWQQVVSWYLVFCLVFAGAVGLSPILHLWVEHGGEGRAHIHIHAGHATSGAISGKHAHPHPHRHDAPTAHGFHRSAHAARALLVEKYKQPTLLGWEVQDVYRAVSRLFARVLEQSPYTPPDDANGHTHDSLPQLLLAGAVEGAWPVLPFVCAPLGIEFSSTLSFSVFLAADFEAQTASRAPPARI
ncbi:MAG TPA: hypothetical protein VNT99_02815 [Methylomirabilota bacterium]|nr:hypothetical protein [Methylomirabilota bacterium]